MSRRLRCYVAGSGRERLDVVRPLVDRLLDAGVWVTYDWTRDPAWDDPSAMVARDAARRDMAGVMAADVLWYVGPAELSEGSSAELGAALALGLHVVASGPARPGRIFDHLATEVYSTHEQALGRVIALCGRRL
jgi:hypothetical protein